METFIGSIARKIDLYFKIINVINNPFLTPMSGYTNPLTVKR
jgi:hypothetical protein